MSLQDPAHCTIDSNVDRAWMTSSYPHFEVDYPFVLRSPRSTTSSPSFRHCEIYDHAAKTLCRIVRDNPAPVQMLTTARVIQPSHRPGRMSALTQTKLHCNCMEVPAVMVQCQSRALALKPVAGLAMMRAASVP
jgi:hypothetical protein